MAADVHEKQSFCYRCVIFLSAIYLKLFFRHTVDWVDKEQVMSIQGPVIVAPNHASYIDPPLVAASWPKSLHFFASSHLFSLSRWFAWLLRNLHSHPVNRENGASAIKEAIRMVCKEKKSIVIFPEGRRTYDGAMQNIEDGVAYIALKSNCPIIPAYISGAFEAWPRTKKLPKLFGKTSIRFGAPIYPHDVVASEIEGKKAQVQAVSRRIAQSLQSLQDMDSD